MHNIMQFSIGSDLMVSPQGHKETVIFFIFLLLILVKAFYTLHIIYFKLASITLCCIYVYRMEGKFGGKSLAGGKFGELTHFKHLAKESLVN